LRIQSGRLFVFLYIYFGIHHPLDEDVTTKFTAKFFFKFENLNKRPFLKVKGWALIRGITVVRIPETLNLKSFSH